MASLDLFVGNYIKWSREIDAEVGYKIDGRTRAYGQPMNFQGAFPRLYHNDGNGHFTDVSAQSGLQVKNPATGVPAAKTLGVAPVDIDGDGWMDLVVANDTVPNLVFINQHDGTFKEIGAQSGVAFERLRQHSRRHGHRHRLLQQRRQTRHRHRQLRQRDDRALRSAKFAHEFFRRSHHRRHRPGQPAVFKNSVYSSSITIWTDGSICSPPTVIWRMKSANPGESDLRTTGPIVLERRRP